MNRVVVECRKIGYSAIGMFSVLIIIISFLLGSCYMDSDYRSYTVIEMFFLPKRQEVLSNIEMNWLTVWANSINGWVPLILPAALSIGYLFVLSEERESGALRQLLLRENDRSYCMSKVIAAMLAGGITFTNCEYCIWHHMLCGISIFIMLSCRRCFGIYSKSIFGGDSCVCYKLYYKNIFVWSSYEYICSDFIYLYDG